MQEVRELVKGLTTVVQMEGLPNRWQPVEIAAHCDLPAPAIERLVSSRIGALIDCLPCRLEITEENGCKWVDVDFLTPSEMQAKAA